MYTYQPTTYVFLSSLHWFPFSIFPFLFFDINYNPILLNKKKEKNEMEEKAFFEREKN